jgi:hypothetical protein
LNDTFLLLVVLYRYPSEAVLRLSAIFEILHLVSHERRIGGARL